MGNVSHWNEYTCYDKMLFILALIVIYIYFYIYETSIYIFNNLKSFSRLGQLFFISYCISFVCALKIVCVIFSRYGQISSRFFFIIIFVPLIFSLYIFCLGKLNQTTISFCINTKTKVTPCFIQLNSLLSGGDLDVVFFILFGLFVCLKNAFALLVLKGKEILFTMKWRIFE